MKLSELSQFLENWKDFLEWSGPLYKFSTDFSVYLSKLSLESWWSSAILMSDGVYDNLLRLMKSDKMSIDTRIVYMQTKYKIIKLLDETLKNQLESDELLLCNFLTPKSGLYLFFKNKGKSKYNFIDDKQFTIYFLWFSLRLLSFEINNCPNMLHSIDETLRNRVKIWDDGNGIVFDAAANYYATSKDQNIIAEELANQNLEGILQSLLKMFSELEQSIKDYYVNSDADYEIEANIDFTPLMSILEGAPTIFHNTFEIIFVHLNAGLVDEQIVVEMMREQGILEYVQKLYDIFCSQNSPRIRDFKFAEITKRKLVAKDIDLSSHSNEKYFHVSIDLDSAQKLYDFLIDTYIDKITDIRDFFCVLTGFTPKRAKRVSVINWVQQEKQGLALFVGLLLEFNHNDKIKWKEASQLFQYKGKTVNFNLSTLNGLAKKSKKYEDFSEQIKKILHAKKEK